MTYDTTKRYPRTLGEAFKGTDYACALERPAKGVSKGLWWVVGALVVLCLAAARA